MDIKLGRRNLNMVLMKKIVWIILGLLPITLLGQGLLWQSAGKTKPVGKAYAPPGLLTHQYPPLPFLPTQVPNIVAWYDVSDAANVVLTGSNVTNLKDKSGHGRDCSHTNASPPAYHATGGGNNKAYMSVVNGTDLFATTFPVLTQPFTVYYVMRSDAFASTFWVLGMDGSSVDFLDQETLPAGKTIRMNAGSQYFRNGNGYSTNFQLLSMIMGGTASKLQVNNEPYVNPLFTFSGGNTGAGSGGTTFGFQPSFKNGSYSVEAMIIYSGTVSVTNDSLIRSYLVNEFSPPQNTVFLAFGDSITHGEHSTEDDSSSFVADIVIDSTWQSANYGYPGSCAVFVSGSVEVPGFNGTNLYQIPIQQKVTWSKVFVGFFYGTNDRNNTINTVYTDSFKIMVQAYLNLGVPANHIIVGTMPAHATGGPSVLTGNDSLMYVTTKSIANTMGVLFFDCFTYESSSFLPGYIYTDGIHLTDAGHRAYASGIEALLP